VSQETKEFLLHLKKKWQLATLEAVIRKLTKLDKIK
jgi:hypothetical protein